jgi:RimJ/RimL family protein N-acetyltransferase
MTTTPTLSATVIESDRLVPRKARDTDREGIIEVLTDPGIRAYLGGPRPREGVERFLDQAGTAGTTAAAGSYVIADRQTDRLVGILGLGRRAAGRPGHVTREGGELELSYVLRRGAWGAGLAFEATFEEHGVQQTLAVAGDELRSLHARMLAAHEEWLAAGAR